ncbi:hypothetical protein [Luteimonas abyssi]|uniref:hypothetical protein n=1 Tax=Luteimonas abyssi TaxID=1247514 RepID=UPI000737B36C|nr:hypothetical protein [Luteimonas abyssi]
MEKVRTSREQHHTDRRNRDAGQRLDQLIGQLEQRATPTGTALDTRGHAPQATCSRFQYCV